MFDNSELLTKLIERIESDGPISNSQRYKMCGNAVTTNVVQAIFERIFNNDQL